MSEFEENVAEVSQESNPETCKKKKCSCCIAKWIVEIVLVLAVIGLYILYFFFPKTASHRSTPVVNTETRSGEIVYINIDKINSQYELVNVLTDDIETEMAKQEALFKNRQSALERKYAQFQQNYQSGILTQVQVENAQQQLMAESEALQADYNQVMSSLEARQAAALKQIADSVIAATQRVNAERNASFIFSYQYGGQMLDADPTKDITNEVLDILNEPFSKKKK
ncbi:MAG: OmpH family outer membrane protein [Bacteroidales bacterium]|nr:OmpH family outer membrane protein [Bacteroidales bacterium]